jgi:isopenicillin N synthase-like dioxygenase
MGSVPIIDIQSSTAPEEIGKACRDSGFFYIVNHGVSESLQAKLLDLSRKFFALDQDKKMEIAMSRGNQAWRGYFPVGQELTSGKPDLKEGIYLGEELPVTHPLVKAGTPLHGPNLFPAQLPELRDVVLEYMNEMTRLGHLLMEKIALSLGLAPSYFKKEYTRDPLILFRIFHYPTDDGSANWGVGEHTDYGVLTILLQDERGGLEIRTKDGWVHAPLIANSFVCNIGDMLDRMTGGIYRSTPHRVRNASGHSRLSFPFFFDPNFFVEVKPLPLHEKKEDDKDQRWDKASVHTFQGTYGDYLLGKVSKVFPELGKKVLK